MLSYASFNACSSPGVKHTRSKQLPLSSTGPRKSLQATRAESSSRTNIQATEAIFATGMLLFNSHSESRPSPVATESEDQPYRYSTSLMPPITPASFRMKKLLNIAISMRYRYEYHSTKLGPSNMNRGGAMRSWQGGAHVCTFAKRGRDM